MFVDKIILAPLLESCVLDA